MTKTAASVIQDELADTFRMNTAEGWARFGERTVEALNACGYALHRKEKEPTLTDEQVRRKVIEETDALVDELIEACIANEENAWSTDLEAMEREKGRFIYIQLRGVSADLHYKGYVVGPLVRLDGDGDSFVNRSYIRCWRRAA